MVVSLVSRPRGPNRRFRLRKAWLSGSTTGLKSGDAVSGASVLSKQQPPPQHWLMSLVAVSLSPRILLMSEGLSEMSVVEARRALGVSLKLTAAVGNDSSLSTSSSTWGSVTGVMGAEESSLVWLLHSADSADERGECWSSCDCDDVVGWIESCGISLKSGSDGIGLSG